MTGANESENNQPLWKLRNPARGQRSGQSRVPSFLRFVNRTTRRANVTWIDYDGRSTHYKTLSAGCCVDVNTFVGHPWTFQDRDSGDTLVVQSQAVYLPEAWDRDKDGWPPRRRLVFISLPVYSLRERCLQVVKKLVPQNCIDLLDVPPVLKEELRSPQHSGDDSGHGSGHFDTS